MFVFIIILLVLVVFGAFFYWNFNASKARITKVFHSDNERNLHDNEGFLQLQRMKFASITKVFYISCRFK